eukprot:COSAG04_NODE_1628_length_6114_cov_17.732502_8_plen_84_part_00
MVCQVVRSAAPEAAYEDDMEEEGAAEQGRPQPPPSAPRSAAVSSPTSPLLHLAGLSCAALVRPAAESDADPCCLSPAVAGCDG